MNVVRVAFVWLGVKDLDRALEFYRDLLGLVVAHRQGSRAYLRGYEELEWSLLLEEGPVGAWAVGFKVASPEALEAIGHWASTQGVPQAQVSFWGRGPVLRLQDPFGNPLAFAYRAEKLPRLLQEYHLHRGPGVMRLDHVNLFSPRVGEATAWYQENLAFRLTEYTADDQERLWASWLQRKGNVHDLAFTNGAGPRLHHFAYWVSDPLAVIRAADIFAGARRTDALERGPGRHGISNAMFLYLRDPDGHRVELYTADYLAVDPDHPPLRWSLDDPRRQTLWGHRAPRSWFVEGTTFFDLDGNPVPICESELPGIPAHVI